MYTCAPLPNTPVLILSLCVFIHFLEVLLKVTGVYDYIELPARSFSPHIPKPVRGPLGAPINQLAAHVRTACLTGTF